MKATAEKELEKITKHVVDRDVRVCRRLEVGGVLHQGDVYLHRVPSNWPKGKKLGTRKVAVGQGEGSNHVMVGDGIEVYEGKKLPPLVKPVGRVPAREYLGPVVVLPESGDGVLDHPKHPPHRCELSEPATFQVTYQVDMATMRRVED